MPTPQDIKVVFHRVYVIDDGDWLGSGEFYFIADVGGQPVGNRHVFDAVERTYINLPPAVWTSPAIDVRAAASVVINFKGMDEDVFVDDDLGSVRHTLRPPWRQGNFRLSTRFFTVEYEVLLGVRGTFVNQPPGTVFSARQAGGQVTATTVSGSERVLRGEAHPVTPTPTVGLPPRPVMPAGTPVGTQYGAAIAVTSASPINVMPNPAVIPLLTAATATADTAARLRLSFVQPNTWNFTPSDPRLTWTAVPVSGAPAVSFVGAAEGREVLVYGTAKGEVKLEVRLGDALVTTYRALVDNVRLIPCRFSILRGATPGARPRSTAADVQAHVHIANCFLRQLGIELAMDTNVTVHNGAVVSAIPGIFTVSVANGVTRNTSGNTAVTRNRRAGVLNFAYIKSDSGGNLGVGMFFPASGAGATISDSGTPSTSWISPSGVAPDGAAGNVTMRLIPAIAHPTIAGFAAMFVTDTNGVPTNPVAAATYGGTIAHEVCHLFNLNHRVDTPASPFNDGLNYPPGENVMHWINPTTIAQSFDIIQAKAVRRSPLVPP
jgi:hypothetical protein